MFWGGAMVRSNPNFNDSTAWMQNQSGQFFWTCDMCGGFYPATTKCELCPSRGKGGKGIVGGKVDMAEQGKKGFGHKKGQFGNQWQEGAASYGKPKGLIFQFLKV